MIIYRIEKHLKSRTIVQVFAGVDLVSAIDAVLLEHIKDRTPPAGQLGEAFLDQSVGLAPTLVDGIWDIYYCRYLIGQLDQHKQKVTYDRRLIESRSARLNQTEPSETPAKR